MEAVILAGGKGTRLKPYTVAIPKPLVPVGDVPILEIVIGQLKKSGFTKITIAVSHMAEMIMAFLGDGERYGLRIVYSREKTPLGTVAPVRLIDNLPEAFLVMNGDVLTDLDYLSLFASHRSSGTKLTVATCRRESRIDFGVLDIDRQSGTLKGFHEKPVYHHDVSMGVYVFSREILRDIPQESAYGIDDLVLDMLARGEKVHAYYHEGYWLDIGRPEDYEQANNDVGDPAIFGGAST